MAFIQGFIASHVCLETLCGYVEIERAHRTSTQLNKNRKSPRPIHVAFLKYTDKTKILKNAAVRLKDNTFHGNLIGIGAESVASSRFLEPRTAKLVNSFEEVNCFYVLFRVVIVILL